MATLPTERFGNRAKNYARSRPGYPDEVYGLLVAECGVRPRDTIADVGSGTGLFTRLLLERGHRVYGVEPNGPMREAGERYLGQYGDRFVSVEGTGEATGLPDAGVDAITVVQAFHWIDPDAGRAEFARILRGDGPVVLIWNDRADDGSPLMRGYQELVRRHATDFDRIDHRYVHTPETLGRFFGPAGFEERTLPNSQQLDRAGFEARLASCSYLPASGEPGHEAMLADASRLFEDHARDGRVTLIYDTRVYWARR